MNVGVIDGQPILRQSTSQGGTTGGGVGTPDAALEFWIGIPDFPYGPQLCIPIIGTRMRSTISGGPYVLAAGESFTFFPHILRGTTTKALSMATGDSEIYVSNSACTQRIGVENDDVPDLLATLDTPIPLNAIDGQTGTDLTVASGNSIKSTAGGVFQVTIVVTMEIT